MNSYNDKEEKIIEMIESLIRNGVDAELIVSRFESKIFDLKKPELYFWFVKIVKGIGIESNEQRVINSGDPEWNYKFVRDIKGTYGIDKDVDLHNQIESELESLDNYLDDAVASSEKDVSKSMTK